MLTGKHLIEGHWQAAGPTTFRGSNPTERRPTGPPFHQAEEMECARAAAVAAAAFRAFSELPGSRRAEFLRSCAGELQAARETLLATASDETGLPLPRLSAEMERTCLQLEKAATLAASESWREPCQDAAPADQSAAELQRFMVPVGPVLVFPAGNFPFAYSVLGSDCASALAVGCPVVVKAHEDHPGVSELSAACVQRAMQKQAIPVGAFALLQGPGEPVGRHLIQAEPFQAAGFTGSFRAGTLLGRLASQRRRPIPFFAEMGSLNPVLILPEAQQEAGYGPALVAAISRNAGQFCTRPSLLLLQECAATQAFLHSLADGLRSAGREVMLAERIFHTFRQACATRSRHPGLTVLCGEESQEEGSWLGQPALLATDALTFLANDALREEVFGPFSLAVRCAERASMLRVVESLEGQLTGTLLGSEEELQAAGALIGALAKRVGRLIFNGMPTGVRVSPAMHHGGPWPASSDSRFGAVDGLNYRRWVRPICWQNAPPSLLPGWLKV